MIRTLTTAQLPDILAIFNDAITNTTALYDYEPRTLQKVQQWYAVHVQSDFPMMGAFDEAGTLLGFATYSLFRPHDGYKFTLEHSVYVRSDARGHGIGKALLTALIAEARKRHVHSLIGVIDADNAVSISLHQKLGFNFCGKIPQAGFKFGRWLDVVFYQLQIGEVR
ncbi:phosphinothricin acetyltransferase [Bacteroidia bacterium]|nr:phosphinothricin acetyltransferase [Bacteroidia bacterium]